MDTILAWILRGTDTVKDLIVWAEAHQFAASFIGLLVANLAYKFIPHGGVGNDIYDVVKATFSGVRLESSSGKKETTLKTIAIFVLCLGLCACSTFQVIKSGNDDPKTIAEAVCSDLQLTLTAAQAMDAWAVIYFPDQADLLNEAGTYLSEAEDARSAACAAIALVTDVDSLNTLLGKKAEVLSLVSKVTALIAKIKGTSSAEVEREMQDYRTDVVYGSMAPLVRWIRDAWESPAVWSVARG